MNKIFYLPIKSTSLPFYFQSACVCPTKYLKEDRNKDIQNKYDNSLLFSKTKFTDETNCALEIVLDFNNEEVRRISENFFLFDNPLPISRVKNVFFQNEKQKKNTAFDINDGAAFIPENLLRVDNSTQIVQLSELDKVSPEINKKDFTGIIDRFNKLLGGFALMSISGEKYQNYSSNYFDTLALINSIVKDEVINQRSEPSHTFDWLIMDVEKFRDLRNDVFGDVNASTVENYSKKTGKPVIKNNGIYQLKEIDNTSMVYLIAALANYGVGKRKSIDSFISDFNSNEFPQNKKEGLAVIFGINNGYTAFRNKYKTQNFSQDIKFKLDSQLDYYTIESIYQFVFNGITHNRDFRYLLEWCPQRDEDCEIKGFETYQVLDKTIIHKKKEEIKKGSFQELYQKYYPTSIYEKIVGEINKYLPPYLLQGVENKSLRYFKKVVNFDLQAFAKQIYDEVREKEEARLKLEIEKHDEQAKKEKDLLDSQIQSQLEEIKSLSQKVKELEESSSRLINDVEKSKTVVDTKENDKTPDNKGVKEALSDLDSKPKADESPVVMDKEAFGNESDKLTAVGSEKENTTPDNNDVEESKTVEALDIKRKESVVSKGENIGSKKEIEIEGLATKEAEANGSKAPKAESGEPKYFTEDKVIFDETKEGDVVGGGEGNLLANGAETEGQKIAKAESDEPKEGEVGEEGNVPAKGAETESPGTAKAESGEPKESDVPKGEDIDPKEAAEPKGLKIDKAESGKPKESDVLKGEHIDQKEAKAKDLTTDKAEPEKSKDGDATGGEGDDAQKEAKAKDLTTDKAEFDQFSDSGQLTFLDNPDQSDEVKDYEATKNDLKSGEKGQSESPSENTDETVKKNRTKVIYQGKTIDDLISKIAPEFEIEAKKSWGKKKIIDEILKIEFKKD